MKGQPFANVDYISGVTSLGGNPLAVTLVAHPEFLEMRDRKSQAPLLTIPWLNIERFDPLFVNRRFWDGFVRDFADVVFGGVERTQQGMQITYHDAELQRPAHLVIGVGTLDRYQRCQSYILSCRDHAASLGSGPEFRS